MEKYDLIREQLIYEGSISPENLFEPDQFTEAELLLTHDQVYWKKLKNGGLTEKEMRRTGFPWSPELVHREITIGKGTYLAAKYALKLGIGMNISGGTHHAFTNRGEGFCLLNDIAMAANLLLAEGKVKKVLVVDLDVHQGNGTAQIFRDEPRVFTFSMHCRSNFPLEKEQSDLDIALPPYLEDKEYLKQLYGILPKLLDEVQPDKVFYLSGVDVLATDKLGRLNLSRKGCLERDRFVLETMKQSGIAVTVSMGGGYSENIRDIIEAHCNTFRLAQKIFF